MGSRSRGMRWIAPLLVLAASACIAAAARGAPADDYRSVAADYRGDSHVTPCRFTRAQLVNARTMAAAIRDLEGYAPGFRAEISREIARHDSGGCRGARPGGGSPLRRLRIARIAPRGGLTESVTIRNSGSRAVNLGRATLRDRSGNRVRLPAGTRLGARRALRVVTGCARGLRRAVRRGSRLYACRRSPVWDDRGDVVKVVDSRGIVVTQRGYGTRRRVARF